MWGNFFDIRVILIETSSDFHISAHATNAYLLSKSLLRVIMLSGVVSLATIAKYLLMDPLKMQ